MLTEPKIQSKIPSHSGECVLGEGQFTAQKMKFSIKDFFSKCDQIRRKLPIWLHLLKKSLMENFISCAVVARTPTNDEGLSDFHYSMSMVLVT